MVWNIHISLRASVLLLRIWGLESGGVCGNCCWADVTSSLDTPSAVCCSVTTTQRTRRSKTRSWMVCSRSLGISRAASDSHVSLRNKHSEKGEHGGPGVVPNTVLAPTTLRGGTDKLPLYAENKVGTTHDKHCDVIGTLTEQWRRWRSSDPSARKARELSHQTTHREQWTQKDRARFFAECVFFSPKKTKIFAPSPENAPTLTWESGWREPATGQRARPSPPSLRAAALRPPPRRVGAGPRGPASRDTAWLPGSFSTR